MHSDFLGPTFAGRSMALDPTRCINFVPEINPNPVGKAYISLTGSPGTQLLFDVGNGGPVRALYVFNGLLFVVSGNGFYSWNGVTLTKIGTLSTITTMPVIILDNGLTNAGVGGNQLMIVDGVNGYIYNVSTSAFTIAPTPATPSGLAYLDGYFIICSKGSQTIWVSSLYDGTTWPGLAVANALETSEPLVAVTAYDGQLFLFKLSSAEVWYDTGTTTDIGCPFSKLQGTPINYGVTAPASVLQQGDYLYAMGSDGTDVRAVQFAGYSSSALFPPAIAYRVAQFSTSSDCIVWAYSDSGHDYVVWTFPTGNATYVYDNSIQMWHERSTYDAGVDRRNPNRHCGNCYAFYHNQHVIGDYRNGMVYTMSSQYYSDNSSPIISTRIAPIFYEREDFSDLFFYDFYIDAEVGRGMDSLPPGNAQLDPPQVSLSISVDGGARWSNEYPITLGLLGQYMTRLRWRKVGYSFNMVVDVTCSDPVSKILVDAYTQASL